jgi:Mg-chelatase subunit ChlD
VAAAVRFERREVWTREELSQFPVVQSLSDQPGQVDRRAFADAIAEDPELILDLMPHLAKASDGVLRRVAREVAGRLVIRFAEAAGGSAAGDGKWRSARWTPGAEVDLEAVLEELLIARSLGEPLDVEHLQARTWQRRQTAVCLVVDNSGSMGASRLSAAAVATAALAMRAPSDFSVIAVADKALVLRQQGSTRPVEAIVDDLFGLRSFGWTNLALGLTAARAQLARSSAGRKMTLLLTDGQANRGADPATEAARLQLVHVIVPGVANDQCRDIARAGRGSVVEFEGLREAPGVISRLLRA